MLVAQLLQIDYPAIHLTDKVSFALQLMDDYDVQHLPVLVNDSFVGILSKEDLLDADEQVSVTTLQEQFIIAAVKKEEFFLSALRILVENDITLVPVINETKEYQGVIVSTALLEHLSVFVGTAEPGGMIVLEVDRRNYSFGEISRLIETNDAYITQLNTYTETDTGLVIVTIKVNKVEISDIIATFHRFEYTIRYYFGEEQFTNELKENYNHLMAYLNI